MKSVVPVESQSGPYGLPMDSMGIGLGLHRESQSSPCGVPMGPAGESMGEHFTLSHTSWWSPPGVHLDSIRIPWNFAGVHQESIRTPLIFVRGTPGGFQEFTWTPDGVLRNSTGLMEFFRTPLWCPDGVQQEDSIWSPSGLRTENLKIEKIKVVPNRMFYISI